MRFTHCDLRISTTTVGIMVLLALCAGSASAQQFQTAVPYSTHAATPSAVAAGDFNNDGRIDLVVQCDRVLDIFFALQNGAFGKRVQTPTTGFEDSIAVADFDHDGNADVVTSNHYQSGTISVLLGKGDGTFRSDTQYPTNSRYTEVVAVADLNGDGVTDIVAGNYNKHGTASVFLGNGDGTFQSVVNYPVGGAARGLDIADFNGDGVPDLAVTVETTARILLGVGDGTFLPHVDYPARFVATDVKAADMNNDGKVDLVVASWKSQVISVLLCNGDGTFAPKKDTPGSALALAVADFNGDGLLDVLTAQCTGNCQPGNAELLLGKGNGTFQPPTFYPAGDNPDAVFATDFSRDGFPDVAVADYSSGTVNVLLNTGK